ncbi:MAG TPA: PilT/PilU family type 4a pilus ATPase [Thiobacillaceae bacterium]|nr:PilT/PilU family type 4a pilus ATPase [Thiobacillaceae bacterium]HNU64160.1 PilT/PilU family type 4a pilus ATPase [Thiobacillaceae bacterium]
MTLLPSPPPRLFEELLARLVSEEGSDLHLCAGRPASLRRHGHLTALEGEPVSREDMETILAHLLTDLRRQDLDERGSADLGYSSRAGERYRVNIFTVLGEPALVARHLPGELPGFASLGLPESLRELADIHAGLVLVTGATGSGKSTTLAAIVHEINQRHHRHILTIEDPVEYLHASRLSLISHRELGLDVPDFAGALRAALREDPDVILVGELRDTETMRAALMAAETGHLVFSTLHTNDAAGTVERFIGGFPGDEQDRVRHRLSLVLKAVVAQQLVRRADGQGRVPILEILRATPAIANLIASARTAQIYSAIESGAELGMQTADQCLADLVRRRVVRIEEARALARDPRKLEPAITPLKGRGRT